MSEPWLPPEHGNAQPGLRRQVARGLTWTIVNTWGEQALNLVVFIVLARLLTPVDFGLVALAAVFVAFAQLFVDQGLGDALVQRRELTGIHIDTAFWVAMATGALLTIAGIVLAYPIGALLGEPDLVPILQALSLTFVFVAMSSIQMALLRRALAFRSLAIRAIVAAFVGGVVGIALALAGAGAWALVGQQLAAAIASVVALWRGSPWRPSFGVSGPHFREL
ncbi:MAG TPA: oligosaccharide flippase family protein, partial [Candidatus Limnocylindria bacterium]|nr:oligosaccharide flippase family protein [Candidatus Limnocylindria bacterium]